MAHLSRMMFKEEVTETQKKRLEICKTCVFNSDNKDKLGIKDKFYKVINKAFNRFYGLKVTLESICTLCGCDIVMKSSVFSDKNECQAGKWKY